MSVKDAIAKSSAKPAGKRPYFFTPEVERVLDITLAVSQELAVTRQRLDTVERLLAKAGVLTQDEINHFSPTKAESDERGLWNQEYVARILRVVQQEAEAIEAAAKNELSSEEYHLELEQEKA
jgi:hypothetical protein